MATHVMSVTRITAVTNVLTTNSEPTFGASTPW